jgi:hypothetical protein
MKALQVIRSGEVQGEYVFNLRMVRLYIWLQSISRGLYGRTRTKPSTSTPKEFVQ